LFGTAATGPSSLRLVLSSLHPQSAVLSSRFLRLRPTAPELRGFGVRTVEMSNVA
jgi:hypothetical protein